MEFRRNRIVRSNNQGTQLQYICDLAICSTGTIDLGPPMTREWSHPCQHVPQVIQIYKAASQFKILMPVAIRCGCQSCRCIETMRICAIARKER